MNTKVLRKVLRTALGMSALAAILIFACGCKGTGNAQSVASGDAVKTDLNTSTEDEANASDYLESIGIDAVTLGIEPNIAHDENRVGFQLDAPEKGDTIAILHTSMGDITIRFFPAQAPKAVTNFINLAKKGKYDNTLFNKASEDFVVGGGYCGTSSYGSAFEDEFCDRLFNIRGAVAMSNTGYDSNESTFFINQKTPEAFENEGGWSHLSQQWESVKAQLEEYKDTNLLTAFIEKNGNSIDKNGNSCYNTDVVPDEVKRLYEENGGNAFLDGAYNAVDRGYTVFAQVTDGMEVVDRIARSEVDDEDVPIKNIVINSVEITTVK